MPHSNQCSATIVDIKQHTSSVGFRTDDEILRMVHESLRGLKQAAATNFGLEESARALVQEYYLRQEPGQRLRPGAEGFPLNESSRICGFRSDYGSLGFRRIGAQ
jgi:hypothetical protein